jgi:hypothetical protein
MRKSLSVSLVAAALVAGGTAYAQAAPRGEMTRADVERRTNAVFERMDVNRDGRLDNADREAARRQAFDRIDTDGNGEISFAEFDAQRGLRETRAERRDPRNGAGETRPGQRGMRGFGGRGMGAADTDGDGAVSQTEFASAALARFDSADADRNGTISLEERREARQHRRQEMRRGRPGRDAG